MPARPAFLIATALLPLEAASAFPQFERTEPSMPANAPAEPRGPAHRSLAALERTWMDARFYCEALIEEGRMPTEDWTKSKLNALHGTFDIRDPDTGEHLQKVVNGVRVPPSP